MSCHKKCLTCKYSGALSSRTDVSALRNTYCNYIGITGIKRPCKAGKDCTVYEKRTKENKQKWRYS